MSSASTLSVRVARKATEALDICTFELVDVNGAPLPAFAAGSHVDVQLPGGVTRQYSLCNDPTETHRYLIGVLRDPKSRSGSKAMHEQVREGQALQISTPKNHFPLAYDAKRSLLLAGGIGVTPILCMAERLAMTGAEFEMHYCTRAPERTAFLNRIKRASFAQQVKFHFDAGPAAQQIDMAGLLAAPQARAHLYVCGPKGFMDAVLKTARANGWPEGQLHYEFFGAEVAASDKDTGFDIKLASSGRIVTVQKGQTVVKALAQAGVDIMTSCEQGVCGTCLTRVLEGVPEHKDSYLSPQEQAANDQFTPCCSRSRTPLLVLDL